MELRAVSDVFVDVSMVPLGDMIDVISRGCRKLTIKKAGDFPEN